MSLPADLLHAPLLAPVDPGRPAVVSSDCTLTYGDLATRSRRLAGALAERGVGPGTRVAVVLPRGWAQIVAVVAVLRAGAAYVPVDATNPPARIAELIERSDPAVVIADGAPVGAPTIPIIGIDEPSSWISIDEPSSWISIDNSSPEDLAYVIFTSGSTGRPKGVMIQHRAAMNTITDINDRFGVGPQDRTFVLSSLAFDLSVYDIFGALAAGATMVIPGPAERMPRSWLRLLTDHGVTIWNSVPALMSLLVEHVAECGEMLPPSLRLVLLSGDWIPLSLPDRIRQLAPAAQIVSLGGATEGSIWSILYPVERTDPQWRSVPYGHAMANQTVQVLGADFAPPHPGDAGEICIGGAGLAQGYWRDQEATAAAFGLHPGTGERLYRTGDLGRYLPDGAIELLGRRDHQVKIHGHRIELGEVEHTLERHPAVVAAAARVVGDRHASRQLIGYFCSAAGSSLTPAELREFLAGLLPAYMVPSALVPLTALPLSANGKVDRAALPWP